MSEDDERLVQMYRLVDAQKIKIKKLGDQVRVAHRQRVKSIPSKTLFWILMKRVGTQIKRRLHL